VGGPHAHRFGTGSFVSPQQSFVPLEIRIMKRQQRGLRSVVAVIRRTWVIWIVVFALVALCTARQEIMPYVTLGVLIIVPLAELVDHILSRAPGQFAGSVSAPEIPVSPRERPG
jgi:hypothetical protein